MLRKGGSILNHVGFIFLRSIVVYLKSGSRLAFWWIYVFSYCFHLEYRCVPKIEFSSDILLDISIDILTDISIDILTDILLDISIDILTDISIDILTDILTDISIDISIDILTDKEEGGGRKEWTFP